MDQEVPVQDQAVQSFWASAEGGILCREHLAEKTIKYEAKKQNYREMVGWGSTVLLKRHTPNDLRTSH
jgi:hypothetical protein